MKRRLAAILAADVVGYSRMMEQDETGTMAALKARRKDVLEPLVARHGGRIFKVTGDGVLVEFTSAVDAVQCAVDLQRAMATANADLPPVRHIVLRVGVNLGDVMVEGSDLYGDGVNISARLERIAEPGEVLISGATFDHVRNKVDTGFEGLGAQTLKNIAEPVRVYRAAGMPRTSAATPERRYEKPSIAVLPFDNMSGDPDQKYFSDGITEDIITELSRFRQLFVIARNSSFQFRGPLVDLDELHRKLGVQYVVEGGVRKSGEVVRITAQLIDVSTGNHLWAERYDRKSENVFTVQDEVVQSIVATVEGRVVPSGAERALRKPTPHMSAYDYLLQGRDHLNHYDPVAAEIPLRRAIELDPHYAQAHAYLGASLLIKSYALEDEPRLEPALLSTQRGVDLDPDDSVTQLSFGQVHTHLRKYDAAAVHFERAISLNPNDMHAQALYAELLTFVGQPGAALARLDFIRQRDPYPPLWYWELYGTALYQLHRYDDAIAAFHEIGLRNAWARGYLAAGCAMAGRVDEAAEHMAAYRQLAPGSSAQKWARSEPYRDEGPLQHLLDGLRKAGLPD
ncbi:MAG: adenylate/guanylate cyclase domain-containing protein [Dongiaceae bacterium]